MKLSENLLQFLISELGYRVDWNTDERKKLLKRAVVVLKDLQK